MDLMRRFYFLVKSQVGLIRHNFVSELIYNIFFPPGIIFPFLLNLGITASNS